MLIPIMKKLIYTTLLLAAASGSFAQGFLDNGGFEVWETQNTVSEPKGWYTLNYLTLMGLPETTIQTPDAHSGSYAALLESKAGSPNDLPGLLTSALILTSSGTPDLSLAKVPFTMRPKNMELYYKYFPADGDSAAGVMILTRWNAAEQRTDTVGVAAFTVGDSISVYTRLVVPFVYHNPLPPDSVMLLIASSADGFNPTAGSKLYIDDFTISFETGIDDQERLLKNVSLFPNPAASQVTIETEEKQFTYRLSDICGRLLASGASSGSAQVLDVAGLGAGMYLVRIESVNGAAVQRLIIK